jgi:hypothetical protein
MRREYLDIFKDIRIIDNYRSFCTSLAIFQVPGLGPQIWLPIVAPFFPEMAALVRDVSSPTAAFGRLSQRNGNRPCEE